MTQEQSTGYSLENATRFGWGPAVPPNPYKAQFLQEVCVGKRVLDIGCATGTYVDLLAGLGDDAIGVDPIPSFLEEAKHRRSGTFVAARADALPFADKSIDTTLLLSVLEHVDDQAALDEAIRVTRSRIVAEVPLSDPPELLLNGFTYSHHVDRTHLREYTVDQLREVFECRGCKVARIQLAYPANTRALFAESIRAPHALRFLVRGGLRVVRFAFQPHYSEAFIVADVA
jgi:SAM-dependent methyltransferase